MSYGSAAAIRRDVAELMRRPDRATVAESAGAILRVVTPSGNSGTWSASLVPYMIDPMNLITSREYEAIVFCGPSRSGKTFALCDAVLAYSIVSDPADCAVIHTGQSGAEDYSKMRIGRAIHGSPELAKRLSPRAHDDNVLLKMFRSGMSIRFGWPSLGQLSSKDIRRIILTDVDNFTGDMSIDEAFGLAITRIKTYMSAGICIAESSPARDFTLTDWTKSTPHQAPPVDGIMSLYNSGDRRMWYWPCPDCGGMFRAEPGVSQFGLPELAELMERVLVEDITDLVKTYSVLPCPHCGVAIKQGHKRKMNAGGVWLPEGVSFGDDGKLTGEPIKSRRASFWLGGVAAAYQAWDSMIERYLQAIRQYAMTGEEKPIKSAVNTDQAMPWIPLSARKTRNSNDLADRATGDWEQGTVPHGVRYLTVAVDVQAGRRAGFSCLVLGVGEHGQKWPVDRFHLQHSDRVDAQGGRLSLAPESYVEDWDRLIEKCITREYPLADGSGRVMAVRMVGCDSGGAGGTDETGGVTARAYEFWRALGKKNLRHKFILIKGRESENAPRVQKTYPDASGRSDRKSGAVGDVPVLLLNVTAIKDSVMAELWRDTPGPGYVHFPKWLKAAFFDELTAEVRTAKRWNNSGSRHNEAIDQMVYCAALDIYMQTDKIDWLAPPVWARNWDENVLVYHPGQSVQRVVQAPTRRKSSYLG